MAAKKIGVRKSEGPKVLTAPKKDDTTFGKRGYTGKFFDLRYLPLPTHSFRK